MSPLYQRSTVLHSNCYKMSAIEEPHSVVSDSSSNQGHERNTLIMNNTNENVYSTSETPRGSDTGKGMNLMLSPPTSYSSSSNLNGGDISSTIGVDEDGLGIKGYLSMRDEGLTYHRMKRYYCRCSGVNFYRFSTRESAIDMINAVFGAEIEKVEEWDGRGLLHTYRNAFKVTFTNGMIFNMDADTEDDKTLWIEYMQAAIQGNKFSIKLWEQAARKMNDDIDLLVLSSGGLTVKTNYPIPKFKNSSTCGYKNCLVRFETTPGKRQHHCRNCGNSMCSTHSSRYGILRHYQMNTSVRLCVNCYRVQRFITWLSMLVQRLCIVQHVPIHKKETTMTERQQVDMIHTMINDPLVGISDIIQVLHLNRHGSDEAYYIAIGKLLELSISNLTDFEFFLPQLFHMWLTIDWTNNTIKSVLLYQVINIAARFHVRFAISIYWLARAAVDDSCGWGFGQSELSIPDYLYRKFSMCKLLMMNLEIEILQTEWKFQPDQDIPSSPIQTCMIRTLLQRIHVLLQYKEMNRMEFGPICQAMSWMVVPMEYKIEIKLDDMLPQAKVENALIFKTQLDFISQLCALTERLRQYEPEMRREAMKKELNLLQVPSHAFCPLGSCEEILLRFTNIVKNEGTVFTTRARAPMLIFFEVEQFQTCENTWLQQRSMYEDIPSIPRTSKNAIEIATSSAIALALPAHALTEHASDDEERDSELIPSQEKLYETASFTSELRRRSGSLIKMTNKTLDTLIAAADTLINVGTNERTQLRRKRSVSEGTSMEIMEEEKPLIRNEYTIHQLRSIGQTMEQSLLRKEATRVFSGHDIMIWMTQNEIVTNEQHAIWLGNELVRTGVLIEHEPLNDDHKPFFSPSVSYRVSDFMPNVPLIRRASTGSLSPTIPTSSPRPLTTTPTALESPPIQDDTITSTSLPPPSSVILSRLLSPKATKLDTAAATEIANAVGGNLLTITSPKSTPPITKTTNSPVPLLRRQSTQQLRGPVSDEHRSIVSTATPISFLDRYQPDLTRNALEWIETTLRQHEQYEMLGPHLQILHDQLELVAEYVNERKQRLYLAMESAFGESFEDKKQRLCKTTSSWDCIAFIVKSNDDLRQEVLCLQLIRQIQDIFTSADLPLRLLPYRIHATSASTGVIEYIKNATSLDRLKKSPGYTTLANHFLKMYGDPEGEVYKTAMANYVRSMASYSLVCYFLQIKDRHNGNIMIDSEGHVVHIDFGFILGIAPGGRFSLETAPFKLTSEMVEAMGGTESEYFKAYVILLIEGFLALQQHADTILMMIAIMAQDSSCPCFLSQNPRDVLSVTKHLFRLHYDQNQVIKYVLRLVRRSHNSYRTRQYDVFQKITNGILP